MKTILLFSILMMTLNANELDWVDEQVQAIKPPRMGLTKKVLYKLKNPFVYTKVKKEKPDTKEVIPHQTITTQSTNRNSVFSPSENKQKKFNLSIIINKSAMIDNKWYKLGDIISGYKITQIEPYSVLLLKNGKKRVLSTNTSKKKMIFKNK